MPDVTTKYAPILPRENADLAMHANTSTCLQGNTEFNNQVQTSGFGYDLIDYRQQQQQHHHHRPTPSAVVEGVWSFGLDIDHVSVDIVRCSSIL